MGPRAGDSTVHGLAIEASIDNYEAIKTACCVADVIQPLCLLTAVNRRLDASVEFPAAEAFSCWRCSGGDWSQNSMLVDCLSLTVPVGYNSLEPMSGCPSLSAWS